MIKIKTVTTYITDDNKHFTTYEAAFAYILRTLLQEILCVALKEIVPFISNEDDTEGDAEYLAERIAPLIATILSKEAPKMLQLFTHLQKNEDI